MLNFDPHVCGHFIRDIDLEADHRSIFRTHGGWHKGCDTNHQTAPLLDGFKRALLDKLQPRILGECRILDAQKDQWRGC